MRTTEFARELARDLREDALPGRWAHTRGVAAQAETLADVLGNDADLVTAAAWLHDIGYAPAVVDTGFHPLDGARYLRDVGHADARLCRLVAHHSCAIIEARERGIADVLPCEFEPERPELVDALTYCDMTTGPDGLACRSRSAFLRSVSGTEKSTLCTARSSVPRRVSGARRVP